MSGGSSLIRGRIPGTGVKDILLDTNQSLKVVQCDENGEPIGDTTPISVIITDINSDVTFEVETYEAHTFHNAAAAAADGTDYTVGGMKTLTVSITGATVTTSTVAFLGGDADGAYTALMGVRLSDLATATSSSTVASATGEKWQFNIAGLTTVRMDLTTLTGEGATVNVKGVAVA